MREKLLYGVKTAWKIDIFCRNLRPKNVEIMHIAVILWTCPKGRFKFWHGWGLAFLVALLLLMFLLLYVLSHCYLQQG